MTTNHSPRSQELRNAVDSFCRMHETWHVDDRRMYPDPSYWDAVNELQRAYDVGSIPADCRELCKLLEDFKAEVLDFDSRMEAVDNPMPSRSFFDAIQRLADFRRVEQVEEKPLDPLLSVVEHMGLPHMQMSQVAKIYGLPDATKIGEIILKSSGIKDVAKLAEIQAAVLGPDWLDPRVKERNVRRQIDATRRETAAENRQEAVEQDRRPCKQTPRELFYQGVSVEQAAKMLQWPIAEVREMWNFYAANARPATSQPPSLDGPVIAAEAATDEGSVADTDIANSVGADEFSGDGDEQKDKSANRKLDYANAVSDGKIDLEQAVVELAREGNAYRDIASELQIPQAKVKQILAEREKRELVG